VEAYHLTHADGVLAAWQTKQLTVESPKLFGLGIDRVMLDLAARTFNEPPALASACLTAKYARGAYAFEQGFHIDPLYAVYARRSSPSFRAWVYLTDVDADTGPTEVLPLPPDIDDLRLFDQPTRDFSGFYTAADHPELATRAVAATAPAGSVLLYQARTHHRATTFRSPAGCRLTAGYSYRSAHRAWMATSWDLPRTGAPIRPDFAGLSVAQRSALGFPPLRDSHWNEAGAHADAELVYPGIDLRPYQRSG
jgi:hypothetical protein